MNLFAKIVEYHKDPHWITTDQSKMDLDMIHDYLANRSYWAQNLPREVLLVSMEHSYCFGLFQQEKQIGFARVITDFVTFAYIADVFVIEEHRRKKLASWLISQIMQTPHLQKIRRWQLITSRTPDLYSPFGFKSLKSPDFHMEISHGNIYLEIKEKISM